MVPLSLSNPEVALFGILLRLEETRGSVRMPVGTVIRGIQGPEIGWVVCQFKPPASAMPCSRVMA